ncbi:hypothetical protein OROHE_016456 [Orobanche hederae]
MKRAPFHKTPTPKSTTNFLLHSLEIPTPILENNFIPPSPNHPHNAHPKTTKFPLTRFASKEAFKMSRQIMRRCPRDANPLNHITLLCYMDDKNIHFCFEAKDYQDKPVYLIYTSTLGDLKSELPPHFTKQVVITCGVPSMGCGLFGSKLVLAGGSVKSEEDHSLYVKHKGVITYDLTTQQLSDSDIPKMRGGKLRPLFFQLNNRLYALDTARNSNSYHGSFELYYPNQRRWRSLRLCINPVATIPDPGTKGISFFSWFAFGSTVSLSLPKGPRNLSYIHHSKFRYKSFQPIDNEPLPFPGMAITYCQHDFEDVVVISFSKGGLVEGRLLRPNFCFHGKPVIILDTKTYSHHVGDLNGWFAHFGNGTFCLTAFDSVNIYVHVFKISRRHKCKEGEDLNIRLIHHSMHSFKYTDFSGVGHTSFSFAGCFAPSPPSSGSKESTEAKIYNSWFQRFNFSYEEDDVPGTECSDSSDMHYKLDAGFVYSGD